MRNCSLAATILAVCLIFLGGFNSLLAQTTPGQNGAPRFPTATTGAAPAAAPAAATRPAGSSDTSVVVIDISEVFKQHLRFKSAMDEIKEEMKRIEGAAQNEQKGLIKKRDQLAELTPGSVDFKRLEEEMARAGSDLQVSMALKQKEIMEREAKVYYNTYMEVQDLVKHFSEQNGIRLVLRYSRMEMDPTKRDSVLQGVNRPIVYQRSLDITDMIVSQVNRGATAPNAAGGGTATRPNPPIPQRPKF